MTKHKAKVSKERRVNTYAEILHASYIMLHKAKKDPEGSYYQFMASLIFTAFALEAFLNHVGQRIFKYWNSLEQLSPSSKLNVIAEKLGVEKDDSRRPFQTVSRLFKFRNEIAHGKSVYLKPEDQILVVDDTPNKYMREPLETPWEKYCNSKNAERALEDVESIMRILHKVAGIPGDILFSFGTSSYSETLLSEEGQNP